MGFWLKLEECLTEDNLCSAAKPANPGIYPQSPRYAGYSVSAVKPHAEVLVLGRGVSVSKLVDSNSSSTLSARANGHEPHLSLHTQRSYAPRPAAASSARLRPVMAISSS